MQARPAPPAVKLEYELKVTRIMVPKYTGDFTKELLTSNAWVNIFQKKTARMRDLFDHTYIQAALLDQLTGKARECMHNTSFDTVDAMIEHLCTTFKRQHFQIVLIRRVQ
ncbi:hypothetical protein H4R24_000586 [Coemansia sp. RSA 988]|nr:hypothetical protein H4R24_000586 [Coemansia sp. RSA 988]